LNKTNPIPQSGDKRLQPTYEKIFHLVKDPEKYYYEEFKIWNNNEIKIVKAPNNRSISTEIHSANNYTLTKSHQKFKDFIEEQNVKNIITGPNGAIRQTELKKIDSTVDHPALMPSYLPIIPILTTSKEGDVVLDPFSGSGTTGKVALMLGRQYIGYELNEANYKLSITDLNSNLKEL
jgi:DNA modification methylase